MISPFNILMVTASFACTPLLLHAQSPGQASAPEAFALPRPEDPVTLQSDEEMAGSIATTRAAWLHYLSWDIDGWDDLWVLSQQAQDRDYRFDHNDKLRDTDGDNMSDYEEMLIQRSAVDKEPILTREDRIALIREERRVAIAREQQRVLQVEERIRQLQPWFPRKYLEDGVLRTASKPKIGITRNRVKERIPNLTTDVQALHAAAQRFGVPVESVNSDGNLTKFLGEYHGEPVAVTTSAYRNAFASRIPDLWPIGVNPVSTPTANPPLPPLWPSGSLGLNLTGQEPELECSKSALSSIPRLRRMRIWEVISQLPRPRALFGR
jgi:hypothetical protein